MTALTRERAEENFLDAPCKETAAVWMHIAKLDHKEGVISDLDLDNIIRQTAPHIRPPLAKARGEAN